MRKILFVLGKDVHNKGTFKIYLECMSRGFEIDVYATTMDDDHTLLFDREKVQINKVSSLNSDKLKEYDYIFSAVPLFHNPLFANEDKYVFMNPSTHFDEVYFAGDFIFTVKDITKPLVKGAHWPIEEFNFKKSIPAMATGGPQFEKVEDIEECSSGKILFIDAGHYPFGTKKQLAEYIIQIAQYCPDYEVRVKPRRLPEDKNATHVNKENLYHYFSGREGLPSNLTLIMEHTDMQDELRSAELVICPEGTSSYEEAVLSNKRVLIFTDFPNQENMLWTSARRELFNNIPENLACRINYKDIFKYLPEGIQMHADDLAGSLYKMSGVAKDIVDAMEYIYINFVSRDLFPRNEYYKSEDYLEVMKPDMNLTWKDIKNRRYRTILYDLVSLPITRLRLKLNYSKIIDYINQETIRDLNECNIKSEKDAIERLMYDIYIENKEQMMETKYSQSLLCLAFFKQGRFSEMPINDLKCKAYYNYCRAKLETDDGKYVDALEHLNEYFEEVDNNLFEISYADDEGVKAMAHYYKGVALFYLSHKEEAKEHFLICQNWWHGRHQKAAEYLEMIQQGI